MSDAESVIAILQKGARSKDPSKSESAKKALSLKPTSLFLHAQKSGVLYQNKGFNKAASSFDIKAAEAMQPEVDKAIYDASEALGLSAKAGRTWGEDSKRYAEAYLKYLKLQEDESKLWNQFVLKLGHFPNREVGIFSDEMKTMSLDGIRKILPMWPTRWFNELKKDNPPTGDPMIRSSSMEKMKKLAEKKKDADEPEKPAIGLDDESVNSNADEPKLRKGATKKVTKPVTKPTAATKKKEEEKIDDLLAEPEEKLGFEPKPSLSKIHYYGDWSEENLIQLATEVGLPHSDRNAARHVLTKRGVGGYPEPDYKKDQSANPLAKDSDGNPVTPDSDKEEDEEKEVKKEIPMSVVDATDDKDKDETNSNIPKGSMLDQITGGDGPVKKPPVYHPTHDNPHPCRVCGRPKDDPCHQ